MKYEYLDKIEEKLKEPRKKRVKVKVVGKSVFKLRSIISKKNAKSSRHHRSDRKR